MAIVQKFDIKTFFKGIDIARDKISKITKEALEAACLQVVEDAKGISTYKDQTGNLRSSIGYVIMQDGKEIVNNFEVMPGPVGSGTEGANIGLQIAGEAARSFPASLVAVVVAGMYYAVYVEAKGLDVLTGSSSELGETFREYLEAAVSELK
jgi:hypothetical protein